MDELLEILRGCYVQAGIGKWQVHFFQHISFKGTTETVLNKVTVQHHSRTLIYTHSHCCRSINFLFLFFIF